MTASLDALRGDFRFQADFVIDAAWRLLAMQDDNPASPSFGCFHYAYWRDKTSEFPDARFQEAGATLGLLSLPFFNAARAAGRLDPAPRLYRAFQAGLENLGGQQYAAGSYDEWYKGERGFAATEFTTIAYALAFRALGESAAKPDRERFAAVAERAGAWLSRRDDRVKANHEAAAAAALALAWDITGDARLRNAAQAKLEDTLRRQTVEGWFPEIGGMDLGYCSVLLDYVMIYTLVTGDDRGVAAMRRLFCFMLPLIHPDGTVAGDMGLCLNPYLSRLGVGLLSAYEPKAQALVAQYAEHSSGVEGLRPYLGDDLRLARWSHLPIVTALLSERFTPAAPTTLQQAYLPGWTWHKSAAVGAYHRDNIHIYVSAAGSGAVRAYCGSHLAVEDAGVHVATRDGLLVSGGYDPDRPVRVDNQGVAIELSLGQPRFVYPGFVARLVLRVGATTAVGSRWLRAAIDRVRVKRRTAGNQSAAPVASGTGAYRLERTVTIEHNRLHIGDRLHCSTGPIDPANVRFSLRIDGEDHAPDAMPPPASTLSFAKLIDLAATPTLLRWQAQSENS